MIMEAVNNPYKTASFESLVPSLSHGHCRTLDNGITAARVFNYIYRSGIRHIGISNYYPSTPVYPLDNPQDSTVVLTGTDSLELTAIPDDAIGYPNAEHTSVNIPALHINGIGSTFSSGSPDGEKPVGMGGNTWKYGFNEILSNLLYSDGGGVCINHPAWSRHVGGAMSTEQIIQMLDFDERVLGIEIYNEACEYSESKTGWSLDIWDEILLSGRRCWGFAVPDHDTENYSIADTATPPRVKCVGRNVLLCEPEAHACLKAYRDGNFYSQILDTDLRFNGINFDESTNKLSVSTSNANSIKVVIDGEATTYTGNVTTVDIPVDATYVRVEAYSDIDSIFSNPIMFKQTRAEKKKKQDIMLFM